MVSPICCWVLERGNHFLPWLAYFCVPEGMTLPSHQDLGWETAKGIGPL